MKKYLAFFRLRFSMGLQYRVAALAGLATQFFWGAMEIIAFHVFYETDPAAFPMTLQNAVTYVWLQQAFLTLFPAWGFEQEIFDSIRDGGVAYEFCRPIDLYNMWFSRTVARRVSMAVLRCMPVLLIAAFLPAGYGLAAPPSAAQLLWFVLSLVLGTLVAAAFCLLTYFITFFTVSPDGVKAVFASVADFLQGTVIPLTFLPDGMRRVVELLPFASMANAPFRVYSGDISGPNLYRTVALQFFWLAVLVSVGRVLARAAAKRTVIQGG